MDSSARRQLVSGTELEVSQRLPQTVAWQLKTSSVQSLILSWVSVNSTLALGRSRLNSSNRMYLPGLMPSTYGIQMTSGTGGGLRSALGSTEPDRRRLMFLSQNQILSPNLRQQATLPKSATTCESLHEPVTIFWVEALKLSYKLQAKVAPHTWMKVSSTSNT